MKFVSVVDVQTYFVRATPIGPARKSPVGFTRPELNHSLMAGSPRTLMVFEQI